MRSSGVEMRYLNRCGTVVAAALGLVVIWRLVRLGVTVRPIGWLGWDDEGHFLITVRGVLDGRPLYDETYSEYGPVYYLVELALRRLTGLPVTHESGRWMIFALWLAVCSLTSWWMVRLTRSLAWGAITLAVIGPYILPLAANPGLPQWFLLLLVTALIGLSTAVRDDRAGSRTSLVALGVLAAALTLTKINSGVYLTAALMLALLSSAQGGRCAAATYTISAVFAAALPFAVMHRHLAAGATRQALVTATSVASCAVAARSWHWRGVLTRDLAPVTAGFVGAAASLCALTLLAGTSWLGLIDGVVVWPLRRPSFLWFPPHLPSGALVLSVTSLLASCALSIGLAREGISSRLQLAIVGTRCCCGLLFSYGWLFAGDYFRACAAALSWVILLPPPAANEGRPVFARRMLAFAAVLHTLHAYPTPGYQVVWATFLLVPVAVLCIADAVAAVAVTASAIVASPIVITALELTLLAGILASSQSLPFEEIRRALTPLDLPGAGSILVSPRDAARLQWVVANLRAHCDTFVSKPGLDSLYFWTGLNPPTGLNTGPWMTLLDAGQQERVVAALSSHSRPCAVRSPADVGFWLRGRDTGSSDPNAMPLARYIDEHFSTAASALGYELRLPGEPDVRSFRSYLLWGTKRFEGASVVRVPPELLSPERGVTLEAWFRTRDNGVVMGCQSSDVLNGKVQGSMPLLYVDYEGRLNAQLAADPAHAMQTPQAVNDGAWHLAALVVTPSRHSLYMDGTLVGGSFGTASVAAPGGCQIGTGDTSGRPSTAAAWMPFRGEIADVCVIGHALAAYEVRQDWNRGQPSARPSR
jgi:hypothetical protein